MVAGIVVVNVLWASGALFGIGLLFHLFPWLFWTLKVVGAGYLVWFGWQLLLRAAQPLPQRSSALKHLGLTRAFRDGIVTNLANPKAMAFYASVFSASAPVGASPVTLTAMVAMVAAIASLWYGGVALILSTERVASRYRQSKVWIERGCGAFLVTFGLRQAFLRS